MGIIIIIIIIIINREGGVSLLPQWRYPLLPIVLSQTIRCSRISEWWDCVSKLLSLRQGLIYPLRLRERLYVSMVVLSLFFVCGCVCSLFWGRRIIHQHYWEPGHHHTPQSNLIQSISSPYHLPLLLFFLVLFS